jgi:hypothetical protein
VEWTTIQPGQNIDRPLKQEIKLGKDWTKIEKATTKKIYGHLMGGIRLNMAYLAKWEVHFNQILDWGVIWQNIRNVRNDKIRSDIWSQIRLNFWSPCLELHQRHLP